MLRFAYNTNGLAHHRLEDALHLLSDLGFAGVALTPDVPHLDPYRIQPGDTDRIRGLLERLGLAVGVETGARYLLDPRRKHAPGLLDEEPEGRARRIDLHERLIRIAAELGAEYISFWAGVAPQGQPTEASWRHLTQGLLRTAELPQAHSVRLSFEPEPGMFVETPGDFEQLLARLDSQVEDLGLTLDVGHCLCTGDLPVSDVVRRHQHRLRAVHLDDIRGGIHEHLPLGEGDLDLTDALDSLQSIGFTGLASVELSRDSHRGAELAQRSLSLLRARLHQTDSSPR